ANPEDRVAYRTWLGLDRQDARCRPYARLLSLASQMNQAPRTVLAQVAAGSITLPYSAELVQRHNDLNTRLTAGAGLIGQTLIDWLFPSTNPALADLRLAAETVLPDGESPESIRAGMTELITQPELP